MLLPAAAAVLGAGVDLWAGTILGSSFAVAVVDVSCLETLRIDVGHYILLDIDPT